MSSCHVMEIAVSAWIDGELSPLESTPALDHLVDCPACRGFYRRARVLSKVVDSPRSELDEEPPDAEIWHRISTSSFDSGQSHRRSSMWWSRLAAVLLVTLGFLLLQPSSSEQRAASGEILELTLEGDRGRMSEERFVALTAELLKADRRFHRKMLEVMLTVDEVVHDGEGTMDERRGSRAEKEGEKRPENEDRPEPSRAQRAKRPHHV